MFNLLINSLNSLQLTCCFASLNAFFGNEWVSIINPSKLKEIAFFETPYRSFLLPQIWLGSQINFISGNNFLTSLVIFQ